MHAPRATARIDIIAIEGLACVGKSTLCHSLGAALKNVHVIPEVVLVEVRNDLQSLDSDFDGFYHANDLAKNNECLHALNNGKRPVFDRFYISTLAHFIASKFPEDNLLEKNVLQSARQLASVHYSHIVSPKVWIYLFEDADVAWRRYKQYRELDKLSLWCTAEGTRRIKKVFDILMSSAFIGDSIVIRIKSSEAIILHDIVEQINRL